MRSTGPATRYRSAISEVAEVLLTRRAQRDLQRLDRLVRNRILERLAELEEAPLRRATRLTDPRLGTYRTRIGDWRVIFDLDGDVVVVLRIGHRRQIYSR